MSRLWVAPIVEGHGEQSAVRGLIQRIWREVVGGEFVEVLQPIRRPRSKLVKEGELAKAVGLAALKLKTVSTSGDAGLVLVLLDRDPDPEPPCVLGPRLLARAQEARPDMDVACVLANLEYETWFVASAESLHEYLDLDPGETIPEAPEASRLSKAWIQRRFRGTRYSPAIDQPAMTASMDLHLCRRRSPSFDKLCRELERRFESKPVTGN